MTNIIYNRVKDQDTKECKLRTLMTCFIRLDLFGYPYTQELMAKALMARKINQIDDAAYDIGQFEMKLRAEALDRMAKREGL